MARQAIYHSGKFFKEEDVVQIVYKKEQSSFARECNIIGRIKEIYDGKVTIDASERFQSKMLNIALYDIKEIDLAERSSNET